MALFDPTEQRICIRIVYDGIAGAGKTTNLRMLSNLFTSQRATELYSPGEVDGRTVFFDWVQIMAGAVCGVSLMCQIISVPGQLVLTPRRRHLLSLADAVVFVCDSSSTGAERGRQALRVLESVGGECPLPFVVQANKQDQGEAISGAALLEHLGRPEVTVVEAIATEGIGVVDTFVNAVRIVSRNLQQVNERGSLCLPVARAPSADDVLGRLRREELDPEWAAEMFLEEAQTAFLLESKGATTWDLTSPRADRLRRGENTGAPLPTADVPAGFIWPANTGRATLRAIAEQTNLTGAPIEDQQGQFEQTFAHHVLRTSRSERFEGREEARQALVRTARERTQLGPLLDPATVLVAQPSSDGSWWVWTITAKLPTLREVLANDGAPARQEVIEAYGVAVAEALRAGLRHGLSLDLAPSSFGQGNNSVWYLGPVAQASSSDAWLGDGMVRIAASLESSGSDVTGFLEAFERELHTRLAPDEIARAASAVGASAGPQTALRGRIEAILARASAAA